VWPQSFDLDDVLYWIRSEPDFGRQAVFLDDANVTDELPDRAELAHLANQGVRIWAPPMWALISSENGALVPSAAALDARSVGLDMITWTLERSGLLAGGNGGYYYQNINDVPWHSAERRRRDGGAGRPRPQVGVLGVFSDWPATTTFYANCAGLR
jgi:glycerophosphoryl diester phosphodiesterase